MSDFNCPICGRKIVDKESVVRGTPYDSFGCCVCGKYKISSESYGELEKFHKDKYILSALTREANDRGEILEIDNVQRKIESTRIAEWPFECIDRLLLYLAKRHEPKQMRPILWNDYPIAFVKNSDYLSELIFLAIDIEYFSNESATADRFPFRVQLTPKGWKRVNDLKTKVSDSKNAFVAMRFSKEMYDIWEKAIKPAISETGYIPVRTDELEYNEKIDDRIIAEIRKCSFMIADLTDNNQGVYFEAGFALGLKKEVIWTCSESDFESIHFDTRQYNYIVWKGADDLKRRLKYRIEALPN